VKLVDGATRVLGIVGDPIAQVRAPEVWSALFRANGVNALCIPFHISPADLPTFFAGLHTVQNLLGLIVTIPHKPAAARYATRLTDRARKVGSANLLRREADGGWTGDIVDGLGLVGGLIAAGQRVAGRRALVVGSGGVGRAIAFAIAEAGAASVHVYDVARERAEDLAAGLAASGTPSGIAPPAAEGFDLVVNASPLGMKPDDPMPIDAAGLDRNTITADVVVHPPMTPWLTAAAARGCHVQPGTVMMDHQLVAMQAFLGFTNGDYTPAAVRRVLNEQTP
jgi:shikimate dehydrogenase